MSDKKLDSFKIGDHQTPGAPKPQKAGSADKQSESEAHSLGFRRIETLLETEETGSVTESLNKLLQSLEELERTASSNKDKAAAKKAIVAVERTADLLDYLFQTKASMSEGA